MQKTEIKLIYTIKDKQTIYWQSGGFISDATSYEELCKNQEEWFKDNCDFSTETWALSKLNCYEEIWADNTYNWSYHGATINIRFYRHKNGTYVKEFTFHRGGDVRSNYADISYCFITDEEGYALNLRCMECLDDVIHYWITTYQITFQDNSFITIDNLSFTDQYNAMDYVFNQGESFDLEGQALAFYEANKEIEASEIVWDLF